MYWEDVYDMFEYASNMEAIELDRDMHFNYMLHVQTKEALDSWASLKIPFPKRGWEESSKRKHDYKQKAPSKTLSAKKATPARLKRMEEVKKKMEEHNLKVKNTAN